MFGQTAILSGKLWPDGGDGEIIECELPDGFKHASEVHLLLFQQQEKSD